MPNNIVTVCETAAEIAYNIIPKIQGISAQFRLISTVYSTYLKLCFFYKILIFFPQLPLGNALRAPSATRSHALTLNVPFAHTEAFYISFFCQAPHLWNQLPQEADSST